MSYTYNWSEQYVNNMCQAIDIYQPHQLSIDALSSRNGISVFYRPCESMNLGAGIILDSRLSDAEQWEDFGHELCHALWHAGNQLTMPMPFQVYQENKSINFAQYLCIPTFMLERMDLPATESEAVWSIMETFKVTREFAAKRLHQYLQNLMYR